MVANDRVLIQTWGVPSSSRARGAAAGNLGALSGMEGCMGILHTWGQIRASDVGLPHSVERMLLSQLQGGVLVYQKGCHRQAEDDLVAKNLKEKCVSAEVKLMVGNIESPME